MGIGVIAGLLSTALDKVFPDADKRQEAKLKMLELEQAGEFTELNVRMEAILAEANSKDPWTSRARPSFLYVMYLMILSAIPFGFLTAFKPELAIAVTGGMQGWLAAIPEELWYMFGAGYLGYTNKRSADKAVILGKEQPPGFFSKLLG